MRSWREASSGLRPMLASLVEPRIAERGWVYEPKYDGIRALADIRPGDGPRTPATVVLYSRNGHEKQRQFPEVTEALTRLAARLRGPVVLDGEIVAMDPTGRPLGFQHIQGRIALTSAAEIDRAAAAQPAAFFLFDLLRDGDEDLRDEPLAARRLRLQQRIVIPKALAGTLRLSDLVADDGRPLLARAKSEGWEGLIAKDAASAYHSGKRSTSWRKLKLVGAQEFIVGGWTEPRQSRQHFGALLLGYYDEGRHLQFAGSVGTGFDTRELARLRTLLDARHRATSPFAGAVSTPEPAHWVRPDLVVEVRFTEWTNDGLLRHPVYLGQRDDKAARDVRRESAAKADQPAVAVPGRAFGRPRRARETHEAPARKAGARQARESRTREARKSGARETRTAALVDTLHELEESRKDGDLALPGGDVLHVTNLAKVFWPAQGITKGELLRYYVRVAPLLLPAVDDRPLVMRRFPNGIAKSAFYQQRHPEAPPPGVRRETLPPEIDPIDEDGPRDRLIGGSLTTLLYMTQLAAISQDPWFSRVATMPFQDDAAIDLDPGDGVGFDRVVDVARWVKDELDALDVAATPKTSGASGLHIYIRLPPKTTYDTGQLLCQIVATAVASRHPAAATVERMVKKRRAGTVYVDYLQNILGKTLATAYSARASEYAGVSTPLRWDEVVPGLDPRAFTIRTAIERFAAVGDLWRPLRTGRPVDLAAVVARGSRPSR